MANIDWIAIKNEYISTDISYRKIAEKYGVSPSTLMQKATREKWKVEKDNQRSKIEAKTKQKTAEIIVSAEIDRVKKMLTLTDKAQEQIDIAFGQLDKHMDMFGNIHECEIIDVNRLKKLVTALKDIKEIIKEDSDKDLDKLDSVLKQIEGNI